MDRELAVGNMRKCGMLNTESNMWNGCCKKIDAVV